MKIRVYASVGLIGCKIEDTIEVDDDEIEGMTDLERDSYPEDIAQNWMFEHVNYGWADA